MVVKDKIQQNISHSLQSLLDANISSLNLWIKEKKIDAEILVTQPQFREKILSHINYSSKSTASPEYLKNSPDLIWLQKHLGPICKKYDFIDFILFDKSGLQVGALLGAAIGKKDIIESSDFFYRSIKGETVISHPFLSNIPLPDSNGKWRNNSPTMFLSIPVKNDQGEIMGVVALRVRPEGEFSNLLKAGRYGESGETYIFDRKGLLLSDSRFHDNLKNAGLIPNRPDSRALLNIYILDPIVNLVETPNPEDTDKPKELTLMAKSATTGNWGMNIQGYNDYRGVPVVGMWQWLPKYSWGITTEIDKAEAYKPLEALINWVSVLFGFLVFSTIFMVILSQRKSLIEKKHSSALQSIKATDERLRSLVNHVGDGIITIDESGSVESINPAGEKIFGYSEEELLGKNINILIPQSEQKEMASYLQNIFKLQEKNPAGVYRELIGIKKDDSSIYLEWGFSFMQSEKGPLTTCIVRDISERKECLLELQRSNQALQDFAAIASHDLKEPLRKIVMFGDRLKALLPDLKGKELHYLTRMQSAAERMNGFILDLLQFSMVTDEKRNHQAIDFASVIEQVKENLESRIYKSKGKIIIKNTPQIEGDLMQLQQLFQNLIGNALKYCKKEVPPQITLDCRLLESDQWEITIEDNGIGFDEKYAEKIFKPFERLHGKSEFEGTGMGLAICKKIMDMHNGKIKVNSQLGVGTKFTLILPAVVSNQKINQ